MTTKQTIFNRINRDLGKEIPTYNIEIPLDAIFEIVERHDGVVVDEAGDVWSGFLLGAKGRANLEIKHPEHKNMWLHLIWERLDSRINNDLELIVYAGI
jgi:hypothetical protein